MSIKGVFQQKILRFSFRQKLSLFCMLTILVPCVFVSFYFVEKYSDQQRRYIRTDTQEYLEEMLQTIDQRTDEILRLINTLAQDSHIINCFGKTYVCVDEPLEVFQEIDQRRID